MIAFKLIHMKKIFFLVHLLLGIVVSFNVIGQEMGGMMYVAAKTGLSVREKPDAAAKVLEKIPYGTKITLLELEEERKSNTSEGMLGFWQKVSYKNKTGFILDAYLLPWAPPKLATIKDFKNYLAQVTTPFGATLMVKSGKMNNLDEAGWQVNKQLFKNGAEWHEHIGYEFGSTTYFLPGFTLQQGFLLLRLIPEFKEMIGEKDDFPKENKTFKKGEIEYEVKIEKQVFDEENSWIEKIHIEYSDGASYVLEMYMLDSQLVILMASGV